MKRIILCRKSVILNSEHGYSWETLGELYFFLKDMRIVLRQ